MFKQLQGRWETYKTKGELNDKFKKKKKMY